MQTSKGQLITILAIVMANGFTLAQETNSFTRSRIDPGKIYRWEETEQIINDTSYTATIVKDTFRVMSIATEQNVFIYVLRRFDDTLGFHFLSIDKISVAINSEYQVISVCEKSPHSSCIINVGDTLVMTLIPYLPDNIAGGTFYYNIDVGHEVTRILPTKILVGNNIYHSLNICGEYYLSTNL